MSLLTEDSRVEVGLESISFGAIIGIYPHERLNKQRLIIDLQMSLTSADYWRCATQGDLAYSVNYAEVRAITLFFAQQGHFRLLESLIATLARALLLPPGPFEARTTLMGVTIKATKPDVLGDRSSPSLSLTVTSEQLPPLPPPQSPSPLISSWVTQAVDPSYTPGKLKENSTAPKRLTQGLAPLELLCLCPELTAARLIAQPHQLSVFKMDVDRALFIISGKWFGVEESSTDTQQAPLPLSRGEVIIEDRFKEIWCVEGGAAFVLQRSPSDDRLS